MFSVANNNLTKIICHHTPNIQSKTPNFLCLNPEEKNLLFCLLPQQINKWFPGFRQPPCVLLPLALPLWSEPGWLPSVVPRRHRDPRWRGGRACRVLPRQSGAAGEEEWKRKKKTTKPGGLCKNMQKIGSFWMKICVGKMTSTLLAQRKGYVFWKPSPAKMTWLLHSPTKWCFYSSKHHVSSKTFVRLAESHQWSMLHKSPN